MSGKVFLDSNILVYAQDTGSADKQRRSRELIARLADSGDGVISTQVMQEFFVSVTRKPAARCKSDPEDIYRLRDRHRGT